MEEEVRLILTEALSGEKFTDSRPSHVGLGTQIHDLFMDLDVPDDFFASLEDIRRGEARDPELGG